MARFGLLCHIGPLRLSSGHSSPVLILRIDSAAHASLPSLHSLLADASVWAASPLVVVVRCIFCVCVCVFFFFLLLHCPQIPKLPTDMPVRGFPVVWKLPSPGWISFPKSFVSVFAFYIFSYLLLKRLGCLSGCLVSSTIIPKLFCGNCSTFKWSFDEFIVEKVVSPSYFSAILWPLPPRVYFKPDTFEQKTVLSTVVVKLISLKKLPTSLIPECLLMYTGGKGRLYVNNLEHIRWKTSFNITLIQKITFSLTFFPLFSEN